MPNWLFQHNTKEGRECHTQKANSPVTPNTAAGRRHAPTTMPPITSECPAQRDRRQICPRTRPVCQSWPCTRTITHTQCSPYSAVCEHDAVFEACIRKSRGEKCELHKHAQRTVTVTRNRVQRQYTEQATYWAASPLMYLDMLCTTTSAPNDSGRWKHGEQKVLSTTTRMEGS